jgi:hypothetical protein
MGITLGKAKGWGAFSQRKRLPTPDPFVFPLPKAADLKVCHAAGAGGEDVALGIAFHAVDSAPFGRREFPFLGADKWDALAGRAILMDKVTSCGMGVYTMRT